MMIDYNVRDDWPDSEPRWVKSLISSLDRRHGETTMLPLSISVQEILNWVELASGEEAWKKAGNRQSLRADLDQSVHVLGSNTRGYLTQELADFSLALSALDLSKKDAGGNVILAQSLRMRTDPLWTDVTTTGQALLTELASDAAVAACWCDLVEIARRTNLDHREYRPVADLLHDQLRLRRRASDEVFRSALEMLAYGRSRADGPRKVVSLLPQNRLKSAQDVVLEPSADVRVVVWLGYRGGRVGHSVEAGNVTFMWAPWFVPNARPDGQDFDHKEELAKIVSCGMFRYPESINEQADADLLARVDLGMTSVAGAAARAENVVNALLNASIHWSRGVRPLLTQSVVLHDGQVGAMSMGTTASAPIDDHYGLNITAEAIERFTPDLGTALATDALPVYLAAALEAQTAADLPYSRERMLQPTRDTDISGAIPLEDRVVQQVAAYAGMSPGELFELLLRHWPTSRWESDVELAVRICLLGSGPKWEKVQDLQRQLYSTSSSAPWLVFVAENESDLLDVCRVESERAWIARMIRSVSDSTLYLHLRNEYEQQKTVLAVRRARARNALVHGNPIGTHVVHSVSSIASYLSRYALRVGLDSFVTGDEVPLILHREHAEVLPLLSGTSVVDCWRAKARNN
jgi:hypothetical protein